MSKNNNIIWNQEKVEQYVNNLGYEIVNADDYSHRTKLTIKDTDGYLYNLSINDLQKNEKRKSNISKFHNKNPYTIDNVKLWCKLNKKLFEIVSDKYNNSKSLLKWRCFECGDYFETDWSHIITGRGCAVCHGKQVGISNCLTTKNPGLAKEWHPSKNGNLTPYDVTSNNIREVWWQCDNNPEHEWISRINNRNNGNGCPYCSQSKGEKIIYDWLINNNIYFISQKEFDGLVGTGGGNLIYDFYLSDFGLLIEFQGIQHEKPIDFKGKGKKYAKEQFKTQQIHDNLKRQYAKDNNIQLLEIWYYDFDNIETILEKTLNELSEPKG